MNISYDDSSYGRCREDRQWQSSSSDWLNGPHAEWLASKQQLQTAAENKNVPSIRTVGIYFVTIHACIGDNVFLQYRNKYLIYIFSAFFSNIR